MPTVNSDVHMMSGLQSAYDSMQSHDTNTLYFCTDTQRYFIGDVEYSRPVQYGTGLPSTYLPPNSLFYNTNTRQLFFSKDGASWQVISSIPSINGVELNGNLTSSDLDIEPARLIVTIGGTIAEPTSDKTYEEIVEAYDEGRNIVADFQGAPVPLAQLLRGTRAEFSFTDLPFMQYVKITINTSNVVTVDVGYRSATNTRMGGVKAANYNEDNYSSSQIAIDSNYFLHAPKLNIDGVELTNSTTAEDLGLQKAGMIVTLTFSRVDEEHPSLMYYTSDTTFQQIRDFHTSYPNANIVCQTNTGMKCDLYAINASQALFINQSVQSLTSFSITINSDDIIIGMTDVSRASSSSLGGVYAADYSESTYQSTQIAIDSTGFLHAPKLSINGTELTNSTTAENLNLKRADFVVNVTPSGSSYIADKTFEEINAAIDSGSDCICYFTMSTETIKIPYVGKLDANFIVFQEHFPTSKMLIQIIIDDTNAVTTYMTDLIPFATSSNPGLVCADSYNDATYFPDVISIDSYGLLHAPKSIFTVTVLANETANMTFEQIQTAYNKGYYVQALYVGRNIPLVQLTGSTAYFRLLVSKDTSDSNLGMVYDIRITSTSVRVSTGYMVATNTQYGLIRADSDTYDETYTKECKMNHADGKLYCQPTMWSFWD